jgi:HAD superfamily hydrolase (TIGR01509 family)
MKTSVLLFDFSRVLLHPKDKTVSSLNGLYRELEQQGSYNFFDYFELNHNLLQFLQPLHQKYRLYILTSEIIQNAPEVQEDIKKVFDKVFSAQDLHLSKKDPEIYKQIAEKVQAKPQEIVFIDDTKDNIEAAKAAGLSTLLYTSNDTLMKQLKSL